MKQDEKATLSADEQARQSGNEAWWTDQTMSYDWKDRIAHEKYSLPWYDEIDARFVFGARLFTDPKRPFAEMMKADQLAGKRVLEIGCGMGFHSELLVRAGAILTSVDLSQTSVDATRRRFELKGLSGDIRQMDAEQLDFPDDSFDAVWSWGVIHHSSHTGRIVRQIYRVLTPGGEAGIMVYSLDGMPAYIMLMTRYALGFWTGKTSIDEGLWQASDGYSARHYTRDQWVDLVSIFFEVEDFRLCGQDADVIPVPRQIRPPLLKLMSAERQKRWAAQRGSMLFTRLKAI
jgi:2-polyprenyl-3-methyl-5-hydroxy-6-metoxy-1,4-benzoquinol methylase